MYIKKQIMQTRLSTWHCLHLLLSAVLLIDISDQQQTRRTPLLRSNDGTHRRTDTQTDGRPLHRAWCAYCACSRSAGACYLQRRGPHWCLRGTHHQPRWWRHRSTSRTSSSYPLRSLPADRNTRLSTTHTFTHVQRPFFRNYSDEPIPER